MHINFNLSKKILTWYDNNKRSLPWRVGKNSQKKLYYRLLSEFMLQQTQVKTVIPYFEKFTKRYKNLKSLSKASENNIMKMWEGLGYYRRARNLLATTKIIVEEKQCKLPRNYKAIKSLPGIGDYTANALLALVHDRPTIAIDGNVKRVFSRILNKLQNTINYEKLIENNKEKLFSTKRNSDFVEALMEFGALVCKPKDPNCVICPIKKSCKFFNSDEKIFFKKKQILKNEKYDIFCYLNQKKQIALTKKNNLGFLNEFNLPIIRSRSKLRSFNWNLLRNYNQSISNKKLNINLYYRFSKKIPKTLSWHSIEKTEEFLPTFTKKIFKQIENLY